jgi:hypothetical protein
MYKLANGWTKEKVIAQVKKFNNGTKAVNDFKLCIYKAKDGNRCAIGCFIPEEHKEALNFQGSVGSLLNRYPNLKPYMPFANLDALEDFQRAHDCTNLNVHVAVENFLKTYVE